MASCEECTPKTLKWTRREPALYQFPPRASRLARPPTQQSRRHAAYFVARAPAGVFEAKLEVVSNPPSVTGRPIWLTSMQYASCTPEISSTTASRPRWRSVVELADVVDGVLAGTASSGQGSIRRDQPLARLPRPTSPSSPASAEAGHRKVQRSPSARLTPTSTLPCSMEPPRESRSGRLPRVRR